MNYCVIMLSRQEALAARFARERSGLVFLEAARHSLSGSHSLPPLREGLSPQGDDRIALALPAPHVFSRELDLPIADRRKLREVVPVELAGETALETEGLVFDALPLPDKRVLAVWAREREVAEQIDLLKGQDLEPEFVTFSPCHWGALLSASDRAATVAVTDGDGLAIFKEGEIVLFRALATDDPQSEVEQTLALLEVAKEIRVERVLCHGKIAALPHREGGARPWLPLPIEGGIATAFGVDTAAALDLAAAYAVAVAVEGGDAVNFRSGPLAFTSGALKLRRRLRVTALLLVLIGILACGEAAVRYYLVKRDLASVDASIAAMYREVFPTRKKAVDEVAEVRAEIKRLTGGGESKSILTALNRIAEVKGDDVTGIYEAEIDGDQVRLKGDARSMQGVNDFAKRAGAVFAAAEVGEMKSRPDGSVSFVFRGTVKEGKK